MKYCLVSDIHGHTKNLEKLLNYFQKEKFDVLIVLGDTLGGNDSHLIEIINAFSNVILIKGNCDSFYDEKILGSKLIENLELIINKFFVRLEHGHRLSTYDNYYQKFNIVFFGHTHHSGFFKFNNTYFINPGSLGSPRDLNGASFITFIDNEIIIKSIETLKDIKKLKLNNVR